MADKLVRNPYDAGVIERYVDMGDGTFARRVSARTAVLLAASAVAVSTTGDTNENILATVAIAAGAMGLNGGLEIRSTWTVTNSANTKTVRVRLGGIGGTQYMGQALTASNTFGDTRRIRNRNSAASQVGSIGSSSASPVGASGVAVTTSTINTSVAQTLVFTGQNGLASEIITLENYEVWLLPS